MLLVDLHLFFGETSTDKEVLFKKFASNINYSYHLPERTSCVFIQHAGFSTDFQRENTRYIIKNVHERGPLYIFQLMQEVKRMNPDAVLMHSLLSPRFQIFARLIFGKKTKLLVQNHGEKPARGYRLFLQKIAGRCVSGFLFVSKEQGDCWVKKGIIRDSKQIYEVMEGSTSFTLANKTEARLSLGINGASFLFLWVGRLNQNKDPLTILKAFKELVQQRPEATLWMVYSETGLLEEVRAFINTHGLENNVYLKGKIPHAELENYYRAADYFILGSHYEGSGYALCEAMACGCVPVVTDIPSFRAMCENGNYGYLFQPGDVVKLVEILKKLDTTPSDKLREKIVERFNHHLSFAAIAKRINTIAEEITT